MEGPEANYYFFLKKGSPGLVELEDDYHVG